MSLVPPSHREGLRNKADSYEKLAQRVILRQDTPDGWLKNDPVLESGEFGYEIGYPNGKIKIGTGSTRWSELPYLMARGPAGQPGAPGPAGPPGKGIQIKGVADVWPPPGTPEIGDLWILDDPIPPTAPAGSAPGDGYSWSGTKWVPTGPIQGPAGNDGKPGVDGKPGINGINGINGQDGKDGVDGESVAVFQGAATPTALRAGDMWIEPGATPAEVKLHVWDGAKWVLVAAGSSAIAGTVDTTGNTAGVTQSPDLPLDQAVSEIIEKAAFNNYGANFTVLTVQSPSWSSGNVGGDGTIVANGAAFGELFYGSLIGRDAQGRATASGGYRLPEPTEQGYLRADQDPATGWYFAEPVVVSDTEPPTPPGDPALPMLWIDPNGTPPEYIYSNANPPVSVDAPIMETATSPLGTVNNTYIEPDVVGAVPVLVNGKRYLLPLLEAPASTATRTPLFTFADAPIKQQSDGSWIGFDDTGMNYYQPDTIAAVPVLVGGKKYLLPLIAE